MTFTDEQQQAISIHDKNIIVTAGAGSGKTRVLVERYLNLLERNRDWKLTELVAITFTEKAAREMRDRVRLTIQERIKNTDGEEQKRWLFHESLLDNARIGTIHSLCAQILRANPAEVPIDPDFEVLDEVEASILLEDAAEQSLAELVSAGSEVSRLISYYGVHTVKQGLKKFASLSESQKFCQAVPQTVEELWAKWQTDYAAASEKVIQALEADTDFEAWLSWQPSVPWPQEDKLMDSWRNVHQAAQDFINGEIYTALEKLCDGIKLSGGTQKNWGSKEAVDECKEILRAIREAAEAYKKNWPRPFDKYDEQAAEFLILWREAVEYTAKCYKQLKDRQGVLDFDDLEFLTVRLLQKYPWVAERYALREFKHLLVDEFQDTNGAQRDIVYKLCGIELTTGRLFVVGDPKQSIYAFRGADVSVFQAVKAGIQAAGGSEVPLSRSFRTHERLVNGLNGLFQRVLTPLENAEYEVAFDHHMTAHRPSESCHDCPIHVLLVENPAKNSGDSVDSEQMRQWEAYEVARFIQDLKESDMPVYDREQRGYRSFDYGDVAILLRAMTHASTYEEVFKAVGLPYVTVAGKGYYNRQEVWDLINLLKALHNRSDNLALASVLRSPMFGLSDDALFALRLLQTPEGEPTLLWDAIQQIPEYISSEDSNALIFARDVLNDLAAVAGRVPVSELLMLALDKTAYDAILTALPDGDRRRGNLEKLLEKARQSGRISLSDFTAYLGDLTSVDPREGEAALESTGAVKIMTVHASKGLEFPVVVLMDCNWTRRAPDSPPLRFDSKLGASCKVRNDEGEWVKLFPYQLAENEEKKRDYAEHKRLFYVAATRAQDMLVLASSTGSKGAAEGSWLHMLTDAFEIECGENAESHQYEMAWGNINVQIFRQPPDDSVLTAPPIRLTGWDVLENYLSGQAITPPLLHTVPVERTAPARHLSVSQLEKLGKVTDVRDFRNSVLHDAPAPVSPLVASANDYFMQRTIGQIVHRALQVGVLPGDMTLRELYHVLRAYAWDEGVTHQAVLEHVTNRAIRLLQTFEENNPMEGANPILRETPFILRTETRIIHGQIDVLYQKNEQWYVLDYKTAVISARTVHEHAKRYHLQVGAYARAVERRLGQTPIVQLYYLHPGRLMTVSPQEWENALSELDERVNTALSSE